MKTSELPGLCISATFIDKESPNFRPSTWPPSHDFPVIIDCNRKVVSRYGDVRWDFSPWHGSTLKIYFGDGPGKGLKVSPENADLLRLIMAWWIWGYGAASSARTLVSKFESIKPIFAICSEKKILASELSKHPEIIKTCAESYQSREGHLISYLNEILFAQDQLGFTLLDHEGLKIFTQNICTKEVVQTPYIPPRIWSYQVSRLKECLDDFLAHQNEIIACYEFCLEAYLNNAGNDPSSLINGLGSNSPFIDRRVRGKRRSGKVFYGKFESIVDKYGLTDVINRWGNTDNGITLKTFSSYLSLISSVGGAYIANFSLMRISEVSKLRADCLEVEIDNYNEEVYLIRGGTSKTIKDDDARWIVSPTVKVAVDAMGIVSRLRIKSSQLHPSSNFSKDEIKNPLLQPIAWEPWMHCRSNRFENRYKKLRTYAEICSNFPKLLDEQQMTITSDDLDTARRMTSNLDPEVFAVGKMWVLSWHQLRRTGAVNMLASGLVSEFSLQYQLKHASQAMSRYYGQNYYKLSKPLDMNARNYYLKEMYQSVVDDFKKIRSGNLISPHSQKRKEQILSEISSKQHSQLIKAAELGTISYRENFLGGCANNGPPCSLGGISNISSCMGFGEHKPCKSIILDKNKLGLIKTLRESLNQQLSSVNKGSPLYESFKAQIESAERAIYVIEQNELQEK